MGKKVLVEVELKEFEFFCTKCKTIHKQPPYCIAQISMGHAMVFTCECGNKINL